MAKYRKVDGGRNLFAALDHQKAATERIVGILKLRDRIEYRICVASGPLEKIRRALSVSSLASFFGNNVFSSYEVKSWKPDPGLFLHAAEAMDCLPERCVVVEDSQPGIQAAAAAGMRSFLYSQDRDTSFDHNSVVFSSMRDLPFLLGCAQDDKAAR